MRRLCVLVVLALAVPGQAADEAAEKKAILDVVQAQEAAWNRGDLPGYMAGYWKSDELSFYGGKDVTKGWQKTFDRYKARYQAPGAEMGKLAFSDLKVDLLSADQALVRGRWKLDRKADTVEGLFTLLMRKLPEGWRVVHDHTSGSDPVPKKP